MEKLVWKPRVSRSLYDDLREEASGASSPYAYISLYISLSARMEGIRYPWCQGGNPFQKKRSVYDPPRKQYDVK